MFPAYLRGIETPFVHHQALRLARFQPTYEGLKLETVKYICGVDKGFQPTYEGLKHVEADRAA